MVDGRSSLAKADPSLPVVAHFARTLTTKGTKVHEGKAGALPGLSTARKARQGVHPVVPGGAPAVFPIRTKPNFLMGLNIEHIIEHTIEHIDRDVQPTIALINCGRGIGVNCSREGQALCSAGYVRCTVQLNANGVVGCNRRLDNRLDNRLDKNLFVPSHVFQYRRSAFLSTRGDQPGKVTDVSTAGPMSAMHDRNKGGAQPRAVCSPLSLTVATPVVMWKVLDLMHSDASVCRGIHHGYASLRTVRLAGIA